MRASLAVLAVTARVCHVFAGVVGGTGGAGKSESHRVTDLENQRVETH